MQAALPELPRVFLDTAYAPPTDNTITVNAGGNLQSAINIALPGDTIVLQAGATFIGNFTLPDKGASTQWIYIRSSAYSSLPAPGNRVSPTQAALMPKLVAASGSVITTAAGAHHYRFIGLEISPTPGAYLYNLIALASPDGSAAGLPHDIVFDRSYLHGDPARGTRRGIALNSGATAVIDSYLANFKEEGADSQAVAGWNGPGPFKIVNNYLEGAGENVMFGGADPSISNLVPSDIEIRGNYLAKPLAWKIGDPQYAGTPWSVKNLFELKNARRVLIEGNLFERNWAHSQNGFAILFTVRNQDGTAPWSVVGDVTFRKNIVRHSGSGMNILGFDHSYPSGSQHAQRIAIGNNVYADIDEHLFQLLSGTIDVAIEHNTAFQAGNVILADGDANTGFVFRNNIAPHNDYGVIGTNFGIGFPTLAQYFPGAVFEKNALSGQPTYASLYPANNFFPTTIGNVGFVNLAGADYQLAASSLYKNAGTDGKDLGADIDAVNAATACAFDGQCGAVVPPSPDTTPPVISTVSGSALTSNSAAVGWTTSELADTQVEYGTTTAYGTNSDLDSVPVAVHSQNLNGLSASTVYHYRAKSRDATGNLAMSGDFTFTTPAVAPVADITAPVISAVASTAVISTGATIHWDTDEPADTLVEYGLTSACGSTRPLKTALVTAHTQKLIGLAPSTVYHYRVKSRDAAGNLAISGDFTLTTDDSVDTTAPSVPDLLVLSNIRVASMVLKWTASTDSVGVAGYRLDLSTDSGFSTFVPGFQDRDLGKVLTFKATGLAGATTYYFRLRAYDAAGNVSATSAMVSATTK